MSSGVNSFSRPVRQEAGQGMIGINNFPFYRLPGKFLSPFLTVNYSDGKVWVGYTGSNLYFSAL
jgi:hypothetical protein